MCHTRTSFHLSVLSIFFKFDLLSTSGVCVEVGPHTLANEGMSTVMLKSVLRVVGGEGGGIGCECLCFGPRCDYGL